MHNLEPPSTKDGGSNRAEICTLTFLFHFSLENRYRNQWEIHIMFTISKMSPSDLTICKKNSVPLGRPNRF